MIRLRTFAYEIKELTSTKSCQLKKYTRKYSVPIKCCIRNNKRKHQNNIELVSDAKEFRVVCVIAQPNHV